MIYFFQNLSLLIPANPPTSSLLTLAYSSHLFHLPFGCCPSLTKPLFTSMKVSPKAFDTQSNLSLSAPIRCHDTSLRRNTPLRTSLQFGSFLFAVATNAYYKIKISLVLKSFVPTWLITVSGLLRSLFSVTLYSCSVLIPEKHSTILFACSVPTLRTIESATTMHFARFALQALYPSSQLPPVVTFLQASCF